MPNVSPLTANERKFLASYAGTGDLTETIGVISWILFVFGFMIWLPINLVWQWIAIVDDPDAYDGHIALICVVITLLLNSKFVFRELGDYWRNRYPDNAFSADLQGGVAGFQILEITRAIEIEEYEDEGAGFLLELKKGGVLCLISQDYYDYVSDIELEDGEPDLRSEFPQTLIEYRFGPNSGLPLNSTGIGEPLRPAHKIPSRPKYLRDKKTKKRIYSAPEDGVFYPGTLDDLCRQFDYKPVSISAPLGEK